MTDMLPNGTDYCQCAVCKKFFSSTSAFDKHRTGDYGVDRRCMTTEEMTARRYGVNSQGRWTRDYGLKPRQPGRGTPN